jgi:integron integrase
MHVSLPQRRVLLGHFTSQWAPRLYDRVVEVLRVHHYARRTEQAYLHWICRYLEFHSHRHPLEIAETGLKCFLTHLTVENHVSASTENQALSAILFLYESVLEQTLNRLEGVVRVKRPKRLPVFLTRAEGAAVLSRMSGVPRLVATLPYLGGVPVVEALQLRVRDLDATGEVVIREGKGNKDRRSTFPAAVHDPFFVQLANVQRQHDHDLSRGGGRAPLPDAVISKFPTADRESRWQWGFPAKSHDVDSRTGVRHRHHLHKSVIQKAVRQAAIDAGLCERVTTHAFRHFFATRLLEDGYDIRKVQELLGRRVVKTTMIYTHVLNRGGRGVRSPLEGLGSLLTPEPNLPPASLYGAARPRKIPREKPNPPP